MMTDKEINELIAEKIMSYEWVNLFNAGFNCIALNGAPFKDNRHLVDSRYLRHFEKIEDKKGYGALNLCSIPDYCNDIAASWQIVEKLGYFEILVGDGHCEVTRDRKYTAIARNASKAICLAVLDELGYVNTEEFK